MSKRIYFAALCMAWAASILGSGAHAQPTSEAARAAWGFHRSDLTPHPGVRFGVLSNGMRYALMRNPAAAGLSVRLRMGAGSRDEGAREDGHMHLIEHLIFHGSANLPRGALQTMLPHQGLRRWSDFNAYTVYDETVYRLDLPRSDRGARETALLLMREIAGHLAFERKGVEGAKADVAKEIDERDAVADRAAVAKNAFFAPDTPIARGPVAGTVASIRRARGAALRRLYARTYVPESATLVMVGDFDPAAVEAEIAARFSDWPVRPATTTDRPPPAIRPGRGVEARLFVDRGAPTVVTIAKVEPLGGGDAVRRRDAIFLEHLGTQMLGRRLARVAAGTDAPFASASTAIYDHFSTARLAEIEVAAKDRDWRRALEAGAFALGRALDDGFSQAELDEQLASSRHARAGQAAPSTSPALADAIVDAAGRGIVFTAPSDASASQAYLARIQLRGLNDAFRAAWAGPSQLIFVSHNAPIDGGEATIAAAWAEALRVAGLRAAAR